MDLSPSWEAARCSATQEFPDILYNPKVYHRLFSLLSVETQHLQMIHPRYMRKWALLRHNYGTCFGTRSHPQVILVKTTFLKLLTCTGYNNMVIFHTYRSITSGLQSLGQMFYDYTDIRPWLVIFMRIYHEVPMNIWFFKYLDDKL
jgi:hypothetical protein